MSMVKKSALVRIVEFVAASRLRLGHGGRYAALEFVAASRLCLCKWAVCRLGVCGGIPPVSL